MGEEDSLKNAIVRSNIEREDVDVDGNAQR